MNAFTSQTSWRGRGSHSVGLRLPLALVGLALGGGGCSETSGTTAPTPGDVGMAGAGGGGEAAPDSGEYGACTDLPPAEPAPELTGRWALRTVASRYVPATGLTSAFYTLTVSTLLADLTQAGADVSLAAQYCEQHAADPEAAAHVVIPDRYVRSLSPLVRTGTYAEGDAGAAILSLPNFVEVVGATLADPAADALPVAADDPTVNDQDEDGFPGVTIKLSGLVSGDLYVVQRQTSELMGIAVSSDRLVGHYEFTSEQNVLDSNPAVLKSLAAQTAIPDPHVCASTFVMVRVDSTATCEQVLASPTPFD